MGRKGRCAGWRWWKVKEAVGAGRRWARADVPWDGRSIVILVRADVVWMRGCPCGRCVVGDEPVRADERRGAAKAEGR